MPPREPDTPPQPALPDARGARPGQAEPPIGFASVETAAYDEFHEALRFFSALEATMTLTGTGAALVLPACGRAAAMLTFGGARQ